MHQLRAFVCHPEQKCPVVKGSPWGALRYSKWWERGKYWSGPKVYLGFSVRCYGKTQKNFLANAILTSYSALTTHQLLCKDHSQHVGLSSFVRAKSLQSCPTLWDPMDCSLPGSSIHGILQARILEWVAMPSSRRSSQPTSLTSPALAGKFLPLAPPGKTCLFEGRGT